MEIKHAGSISTFAKLVKLADKLDNITGLHNNPPSLWTQERVEEYFLFVKAICDQIRGTNQWLEESIDQSV